MAVKACQERFTTTNQGYVVKFTQGRIVTEEVIGLIFIDFSRLSRPSQNEWHILCTFHWHGFLLVCHIGFLPWFPSLWNIRVSSNARIFHGEYSICINKACRPRTDSMKQEGEEEEEEEEEEEDEEEGEEDEEDE